VLQGEVERVTLQWEHAAEQQAALHAEVTSLTQQLHEMREQVAAARDGSRCFEEKAADASEALHLLQSCCQRLEKEVAQAQAAEAEVREEVVVWQSQAASQEDVVRQLRDTLAAAQEERAQLLDMVSSSTAALAATAGRCDELKQHEVVLREELRASQMHLLLLQQNQRGVAAAAAAVADMKRALLDMQDAVPALVEEVRRESERNVYALVAAVTHSMSSKDKAQNTELFNRAMQVQPAPNAAPPLLSQVALQSKQEVVQARCERDEAMNRCTAPPPPPPPARLWACLRRPTLLRRYRMEMEERRRVFERLQQLQGNIRVVCRVRPPLSPAAAATACVSVGSDAFDTQPAATAAAGCVATVSARAACAEAAALTTVAATGERGGAEERVRVRQGRGTPGGGCARKNTGGP
jgi:hypothetical protein